MKEVHVHTHGTGLLLCLKSRGQNIKKDAEEEEKEGYLEQLILTLTPMNLMYYCLRNYPRLCSLAGLWEVAYLGVSHIP